MSRDLPTYREHSEGSQRSLNLHGDDLEHFEVLEEAAKPIGASTNITLRAAIRRMHPETGLTTEALATEVLIALTTPRPQAKKPQRPIQSIVREAKQKTSIQFDDQDTIAFNDLKNLLKEDATIRLGNHDLILPAAIRTVWQEKSFAQEVERLRTADGRRKGSQQRLSESLPGKKQNRPFELVDADRAFARWSRTISIPRTSAYSVALPSELFGMKADLRKNF